MDDHFSFSFPNPNSIPNPIPTEQLQLHIFQLQTQESAVNLHWVKYILYQFLMENME